MLTIELCNTIIWGFSMLPAKGFVIYNYHLLLKENHQKYNLKFQSDFIDDTWQTNFLINLTSLKSDL